MRLHLCHLIASDRCQSISGVYERNTLSGLHIIRDGDVKPFINAPFFVLMMTESEILILLAGKNWLLLWLLIGRICLEGLW